MLDAPLQILAGGLAPQVIQHRRQPILATYTTDDGLQRTPDLPVLPRARKREAARTRTSTPS
jgi:hypothetical protein